MHNFLPAVAQPDPPAQPPVLCPICAERLSWADDLVLQRCGHAVVGCSCCLVRHNATEWACSQL